MLRESNQFPCVGVVAEAPDTSAFLMGLELNFSALSLDVAEAITRPHQVESAYCCPLAQLAAPAADPHGSSICALPRVSNEQGVRMLGNLPSSLLRRAPSLPEMPANDAAGERRTRRSQSIKGRPKCIFGAGRGR